MRLGVGRHIAGGIALDATRARPSARRRWSVKLAPVPVTEGPAVDGSIDYVAPAFETSEH